MRTNLFLSLAFILMMYSCKESSLKITNVKKKSTFDSLANQVISETKFTPELLWKFGR